MNPSYPTVQRYTGTCTMYMSISFTFHIHHPLMNYGFWPKPHNDQQTICWYPKPRTPKFICNIDNVRITTNQWYYNMLNVECWTMNLKTNKMVVAPRYLIFEFWMVDVITLMMIVMVFNCDVLLIWVIVSFLSFSLWTVR